MPQYADTADLVAYPGGSDVPEMDVPLVLRLANRTVGKLLRLRVYDVDPETSLPTDIDALQACKDAACAIAVELSVTGAVSAGQTQRWQSVSIGGVALSNPTVPAHTVDGLPVPAVAVVLLSDVGTAYVSTAGRGYGRPLDRVAR